MTEEKLAVGSIEREVPNLKTFLQAQATLPTLGLVDESYAVGRYVGFFELFQRQAQFLQDKGVPKNDAIIIAGNAQSQRHFNAWKNQYEIYEFNRKRPMSNLGLPYYTAARSNVNPVKCDYTEYCLNVGIQLATNDEQLLAKTGGSSLFIASISLMPAFIGFQAMPKYINNLVERIPTDMEQLRKLGIDNSLACALLAGSFGTGFDAGTVDHKKVVAYIRELSREIKADTLTSATLFAGATDGTQIKDFHAAFGHEHYKSISQIATLYNEAASYVK